MADGRRSASSSTRGEIRGRQGGGLELRLGKLSSRRRGADSTSGRASLAAGGRPPRAPPGRDPRPPIGRGLELRQAPAPVVELRRILDRGIFHAFERLVQTDEVPYQEEPAAPAAPSLHAPAEMAAAVARAVEALGAAPVHRVLRNSALGDLEVAADLEALVHLPMLLSPEMDTTTRAVTASSRSCSFTGEEGQPLHPTMVLESARSSGREPSSAARTGALAIATALHDAAPGAEKDISFFK